MPYITTTLSSAGTSPPINLTWRSGKPIAAVAIVSSLVAADFTIQFTLDDAQIAGSSVQTWISFGSSTGSSATHYSSGNSDASIAIGSVYPLAGLRLSSTTFTAGTLTLKLVQGEGW
jgi:hypothetical protein